MAGDVDAGLVSFLQSMFGFADTMRDLGVSGGVAIRLNRESGLKLLQLVAGSRDPAAEAQSQRNRPWQQGVNSLNVAGLTFEWPKAPGSVFVPLPANDNSLGELRHYGFEEDSPALR